jgi:hypothetical protein
MGTSRKIRIGVEIGTSLFLSFLCGISFGHDMLEHSILYSLGFISLYILIISATLRETIQWYLED